jgi:hypothetical protein
MGCISAEECQHCEVIHLRFGSDPKVDTALSGMPFACSKFDEDRDDQSIDI